MYLSPRKEYYSLCLLLLLVTGCAKTSSDDRTEYLVTGRVVDSGGLYVGGAEVSGDAEPKKVVTDHQENTVNSIFCGFFGNLRVDVAQVIKGGAAAVNLVTSSH